MRDVTLVADDFDVTVLGERAPTGPLAVGSVLAFADSSTIPLATRPPTMSSRSDQYPDETRRDVDEVDRFEEPRYEEEDTGRFSYRRPWGWGGAWGMWPRSSEESEEEYPATQPTETRYDSESTGGFARHWDEGLITLLIVGGAILFLFPEPATSGLGILLMGLGVLLWLVDRAT